MTGGTAIVTAADAGYFGLLDGLVRSLEKARDRIDFELCLFDLGLGDDQLHALAPHCARIVRPGWDLDFPGRDAEPDHFKAMVARPFIPKHFPGFERYLWIDSDAWVQDAQCLAYYLRAASRGRIAIAAQVDRAYKSAYKRQKLLGWTHNHKHYRLGWGLRAADRYGRLPILNSGVFAIAADDPVWGLWADALSAGLQRTRHRLVEQTALNLVIYRDRWEDATLLPAYCNWLCDAARPCVDEETGTLVEPFEPHQPLGVVHMAGEFRQDAAVALPTVAGGEIRTKLRYPEWMETRERLTR